MLPADSQELVHITQENLCTDTLDNALALQGFVMLIVMIRCLLSLDSAPGLVHVQQSRETKVGKKSHE